MEASLCLVGQTLPQRKTSHAMQKLKISYKYLYGIINFLILQYAKEEMIVSKSIRIN
jgi:hypothetical protein